MPARFHVKHNKSDVLNYEIKAPGRTSACWFLLVPAKAEAHERTHARVRQRREDPRLKLCAFRPRRRVRRGSRSDPGRATHNPARLWSARMRSREPTVPLLRLGTSR